MRGRIAFYVIFSVFTPIYFLIAEEYRYALTSKMQKTPLLTTGQTMKSRELILGFILGTGSSSNPKIEHSAGIFGSVGVVSDLIGIKEESTQMKGCLVSCYYIQLKQERLI